MQGSAICVAGIDPKTGEHVRPVIPMPAHLERDLLAPKGPFEIGAKVDLGPLDPCPDPPHTEDCRFDPRYARRTGQLSEDDYVKLLDAVSAHSIRQAFGPEIHRATEYKYAVDLHCGKRSLACLRLCGPVALEINPWNRLQLRFESAGRRTYAPVTDLRFFDEAGGLRHAVIEDASRRLRAKIRAIFMFGLARPWSPGDDRERSWLQLNGLCLEDRPLGPQP